jgi:hypothetical protein
MEVVRQLQVKDLNLPMLTLEVNTLDLVAISLSKRC